MFLTIGTGILNAGGLGGAGGASGAAAAAGGATGAAAAGAGILLTCWTFFFGGLHNI